MKIFKILRLVIIGFWFALAIGCSGQIIEGKILNVERVYWHEGCFYSFTVPIENSVGFHNVSAPRGLCDRDNVSIIPDVPTGEKMWVHYVIEKRVDTYLDKLEIHVHAVTDINGGGWNHGKLGTGQTTVIE